MRIPANHHTTLHYVQRFGLATRSFVNVNPDVYVHVRGRRIRARDADALPKWYGLSGAEDRDPRLLLDDLLQRVWSELSPDQHKAILVGDVHDSRIEKLASTSLWQYTQGQLSDPAWEPAGQVSGPAHYEHASLPCCC